MQQHTENTPSLSTPAWDALEIESQIESIYLEHLKQLGYEPEESKPRGDRIVAYPDNELLRYAGAVQHSIQIPEIRNMKIFWEVLFPP